MRRLTAVTAIAVFAMALAGPDMAKADISEVVIVYGQLDDSIPGLTVELTSPSAGLPSPACDIDADLAGCLSELMDECDCEIDVNAPPFSDTDQGGLVYTLVSCED